MESNRIGSGWIASGGTPMPRVTPQYHMPEPVQPPAPPVIEQGDCMDDMPLAICFVRMQSWDQTYEAEAGLERGTIFPELDLPFAGEGACPNHE